jgi:hypothetical protein
MMSYTMAWTSSCSIGGRLTADIAVDTIIGAARRHVEVEALFLTANAKFSDVHL